MRDAMKKNILLMAGLLAVCIAGQVFLKPHTGSKCYAQALEEEKTADLLSTKDLQGPGPGFKTDNLQGKLFQQFVLMLLLVAVFGAGAWFFAKKMSGRWGAARSRHINVAETVSLGPRKLLHIVHVGPRQFLIASTAENIRLLSDVTGVLEETDGKA